MQHSGNGHQQIEGGRDQIQLLTWNETGAISSDIEAAGQDSPVGWEATGFGRLRAGQRLRSESVVSRSAVFVTFVGLKPVCLLVTLKGHQVVCACPESQHRPEVPLSAASFADRDHSGVVWQVMNEREQVTYCASDTVQSFTSDWKMA